MYLLFMYLLFMYLLFMYLLFCQVHKIKYCRGIMVINILDVKKKDGVSSYIKAMGINEIEIVKVINKKIEKKVK